MNGCGVSSLRKSSRQIKQQFKQQPLTYMKPVPHQKHGTHRNSTFKGRLFKYATFLRISKDIWDAGTEGGGTEGIRAVGWALELSWAQTGQTHLQSTHFFTLIQNLPFLTIPYYINLGEFCLYFCRNLQKIKGAENLLLQISDFLQLLPNCHKIRPLESQRVRL